MIRPPRFRGTAFSKQYDGDLREGDRHRFSAELGISHSWATAMQVHGTSVADVDRPGQADPSDALVTDRRGIPVVVFTADCLAVVVEADEAVGVAHAGWRGLSDGVLTHVLERMADRGWTPLRAAIGPSIGPCCFEVGSDVLDRFPGFETRTTWDTPSVDLWAAAAHELRSVDEVWVTAECTRCDSSYFSHRRNGTTARLAAVGWIP